MPIIEIKGKQVDVSIEDELRTYPWNRARWSSEKLVACSPFRNDLSPSFFVNLDGKYAGTWADSGAYHTEYASGNFEKLLGFLRGTDEGEAGDYLLKKYGVMYEIKPGEPIRIKAPKLSKPEEEIALVSTIKQATSPYLITRGISPEVQAEYGIGYNPMNRGYTALPWHYADTGEIANIKYRSTKGKRFFYEPDAKPVRKLVYGLWQAKEYPEVIICEAEIDALSWAMAGFNAVAIGGAHISGKQTELIIREGFDRVYLAGDNDKQGVKFNEQMRKIFRGYAKLFEINYRDKKDANDVLLRHGVQGLIDIFNESKQIRAINLLNQFR